MFVSYFYYYVMCIRTTYLSLIINASTYDVSSNKLDKCICSFISLIGWINCMALFIYFVINYISGHSMVAKFNNLFPPQNSFVSSRSINPEKSNMIITSQSPFAFFNCISNFYLKFRFWVPCIHVCSALILTKSRLYMDFD